MNFLTLSITECPWLLEFFHHLILKLNKHLLFILQCQPETINEITVQLFWAMFKCEIISNSTLLFKQIQQSKFVNISMEVICAVVELTELSRLEKTSEIS